MKKIEGKMLKIYAEKAGVKYKNLLSVMETIHIYAVSENVKIDELVNFCRQNITKKYRIAYRAHTIYMWYPAFVRKILAARNRALVVPAHILEAVEKLVKYWRPAGDRKSNWVDSHRVNSCDSYGYLSHDNGNYSCKCRYTHYTYSPIFTIYRQGNEIIVNYGANGKIKKVIKMHGETELTTVDGKLIRNTVKISKQWRGFSDSKIRENLGDNYVVRAGDFQGCYPSTEVTIFKKLSSGQWEHYEIYRKDFSASKIKKNFNEREIELQHIILNRVADSILGQRAGKIWVSLKNSTNAGNCKNGSINFYKENLQSKIIGLPTLEEMPNIEIPAELILSARDDNYSRRACRVAALQYLNNAYKLEKEVI